MADRNKGFYFGTVDHMQWFKTPLQGADSSPQAWGANGTLLNGGGWAVNSFGSHKRYSYEWGQSSSPEVAQRMKSYYDGSYGRGLLHFVSCDIFETNVLPAHWADPSMALDYEAPSHVYGVEPKAVVTPNASNLDLPVRSVEYNMSGTPTSPAVGSTVFIPIPEGYTLYIGAFYTSTDSTSGVYAIPVTNAGVDGNPVLLEKQSNSGSLLFANNYFSNIRGIRLWVGRTAGSGCVTMSALIGRLLPQPYNDATYTRLSRGKWVGGQGNSGCRFAQPPTYITNSGYGGGRIGFSASFIEVGSHVYG